MISTKTNPVKNHDNKHYLDLNESVYESPSRKNPYLRAMFKTIASNELGMKKRDIEKVADSMVGKTLKQAVNIMDKHVDEKVVFYYGLGDTDPTENELKLERPVSVKKKPARKRPTKTATKKPTKTTQETLENNMKKQTRKRSKK